MSLSRLGSAVIVTALVLLTSGCTGGDDPALTAPPAQPPAASLAPDSPAAPSPAGAPQSDNTLDIAFAGGALTGDAGAVEIGLGESVTVRVTSDKADEIHLHGYDLSAAVGPGTPAVLTFDARIPGAFELELEQLGRQLATLQVS